MNKPTLYSEKTYRPLSSSSLITQIFILNLFDALLTLYATKVGVGELNPIMEFALNLGPIVFVSSKVLVVTICTLAINKILGHSGRHLYILFALLYWLIAVWHVYGLSLLWGVDIA